ncbi:hypothetical protein CC78DRAFT_574413 [Lojkania enalia]|uniref:Uncharacterized protein n=1 Tax=Lojkania enalia TaxID=147567 RepID=A0A9P4TQR7_9PLEO|nr:hypothetical protein CC78DRAFT_574413 [Didymosphaeria enalia]
MDTRITVTPSMLSSAAIVPGKYGKAEDNLSGASTALYPRQGQSRRVSRSNPTIIHLSYCSNVLLLINPPHHATQRSKSVPRGNLQARSWKQPLSPPPGTAHGRRSPTKRHSPALTSRHTAASYRYAEASHSHCIPFAWYTKRSHNPASRAQTHLNELVKGHGQRTGKRLTVAASWSKPLLRLRCAQGPLSGRRAFLRPLYSLPRVPA